MRQTFQHEWRRFTAHLRSRARWSSIWHSLIPSPGSILFTIAALTLLVWAQGAGALPLNRPQAASLSTNIIAYQGRLANPSGTPISAPLDMTFRLYNTATGGTALWTEPWTGASRVQVNSGLFNVMLGSLTSLPQTLATSNTSLWLGITIGTDAEMSPRVQFGSVPYTMQTLTIPNGSIQSSQLNLQQNTACLTANYVRGLSGGQEAIIPALTLTFTLSQPSNVYIWMDGVAQFQQAATGKAGIRLYVDTTGIGAAYLEYNSYSFVKSQRRVTLSAGQHTVTARVASVNNSGTMTVRGTGFDLTCINYLVLGVAP